MQEQEVENMKWYVLRVMGGKERKTVDFIEKEIDRLDMKAVSYTHLTLPTNREV